MSCCPGDSVLEFGAGPSYASELLNRLGYCTVALDIDPEILTTGRGRFNLDSRLTSDWSSFVAGDGQLLPFASESFDGVICLEALHHMPSYRDALAEIYRVLKPNRRAAFAEPGDRHSGSPESVLVVEQFGFVEKDIVLADIYRLAREVGFSRMILKPYCYPEHLAVDFREWKDFKAGRARVPFTRYRDIAAFVEHSRALFLLQKGGDRELDSRRPGQLQAHIRILTAPGRAKSGESIWAELEVQNIGDTLWLARPMPTGGHVTLGVKLTLSDRSLVDDALGRTPLDSDLAPGHTARVRSVIQLPYLPPGQYLLRFDMVDEQVCWFEQQGSAAVELSLIIE